jgi:hypothetical protein
MINWILNKKTSIIVTFIGAGGGYLYWYFIGCEDGTCAITSIWYRTTIYGAIMGLLLGSIIKDIFTKKKNHE